MNAAELLNFPEFENIIIKEDDDYIFLKTNAKTPDEVERWKELYSKKFNVTLNIAYNYDVVMFALHRRYKCIFGEKRHCGKKKTFTG